MQTFGALLRQARLATGLSREELAEYSGVSVRTLCYIESGRTRKPYRRTVQVLAGALGLEGPARDQFERAALSADQISGEGTATVRSDPAEETGRFVIPPQRGSIFPIPAQLPHNVPGFVGREAELQEMTKLQEQHPGPMLLLSAIDGSPGIGKTALAIHWAYKVADKFPDGQLYVNLQGYGQSVKPVTPTAAIREFLCAFGIPPERIPAGFQAQAALYRSLLVGRRTLIVLDNARDEDQVRPLLPGDPGCMVVVTSRRQLVGLIAADGAQTLTLNLLTEAEAHELLVRRLGAGRLAAEPEATAELIRLCARLPLALAVAAARAAARPALVLEEIAAELRAAVGRLEALDVGDAATSVRAAFSWSYRHLPQKSARLFRLLGLHPGPDIDVHAAASLAEIPVQEARELLHELVHANLLRLQPSGRFAFHDLLRTYAAELARARESDEMRRAALTRLFDHYLAIAAVAMDTLAPAERHRRPRPPTTAGSLPPLGTQALARVCLDTERATLVAVTAYAAASGWPSHATRLAVTLFRYLDNGGYHSEAVSVHTHALRASRQSGDRAAQADALRNLGAVAWWQSRYEEAIDYFLRALTLYRDLDDGLGQARTLANLALAMGHEGRYQEAVTYHQDALAIFRELDDELGQARTLDNLGVLVCRLGRYAEAVARHREALSVFRELGDRIGEAGALGNLGVVLHRKGHYLQAAILQQRALQLFRELGHRDGEAETLNSLGHTLRDQGCCQEAIEYHRGALGLYRELGNRSGQAEALNGLGEALRTHGEREQARIHHREALRLADQVGNLDEQARAREALACAFRTDGDIAQARNQLRQSFAIYTRLGVPEANHVAAALEDLG